MSTTFPAHARSTVATDPRAAAFPPQVAASADDARSAAVAVPELVADTGDAAGVAVAAAAECGRLLAPVRSSVDLAADRAAAAGTATARADAAAADAERGVSAPVSAALRVTPPMDYVSLDPVASPDAMGFGFDTDISNAGSGEIHMFIRPRGTASALMGAFSGGWYIGALPSGELAITDGAGGRRGLGVSLVDGAWQWLSVSLGMSVRAIVGDSTVGPTVTPASSLVIGRLFGASGSFAALPRFVGDVALIAFTAGPQTLANRNAMLSGRYPDRLSLTFRPDGLSAGVWREQGDRRYYLGGPANLVARSTCGRSRRHPCAALFPSISDL